MSDIQCIDLEAPTKEGGMTMWPEWRDAKTDPPKQSGTYLCFTYGDVAPRIRTYSAGLWRFDKKVFKGEYHPGWVGYDSKGKPVEICVDKWMELPPLPADAFDREVTP